MISRYILSVSFLLFCVVCVSHSLELTDEPDADESDGPSFYVNEKCNDTTAGTSFLAKLEACSNVFCDSFCSEAYETSDGLNVAIKFTKRKMKRKVLVHLHKSGKDRVEIYYNQGHNRGQSSVTAFKDSSTGEWVVDFEPIKEHANMRAKAMKAKMKQKGNKDKDSKDKKNKDSKEQ